MGDVDKDMSGPQKEEACPPDFPETALRAVQACWSQAEDLIKAAGIVESADLPGIAFHLAVLALEEVGKSEMIQMEAWAALLGNRSECLSKQYDDHLKKLFWAFWGPSMGHELLTAKQAESYRELALSIHDLRLKVLYVNPDNSCQMPLEVIPPKEAQNLISMANARLEMSKCDSEGQITTEWWDDIVWFSEAWQETERAKLIFSKKSMEKLVELKETPVWVHWLHEQFKQGDEAGRNHAQRELNRSEPLPEEADKPKYQMRFRLSSISHKIRPKLLTWWNDGCRWIKLSAGGQKNEQLLVDMIVPKRVSIQSLYWSAWEQIRRFVVTLNMGTRGCFWWSFPEQVSKYYEKLTDLEENSQLVVERSPSLRIDWKGGLLTESDLSNVRLCLSSIPRPADEEATKPFAHYYTGLAFLCKTDVHLSFEVNAYIEFYKSLSLGFRQYGDWKDGSTFMSAFDAFFSNVLPDVTGVHEYLRFAEMVESGGVFYEGLTLQDAGVMKIFCDTYFLSTFRRLVLARIENRPSDTDAQ